MIIDISYNLTSSKPELIDPVKIRNSFLAACNQTLTRTNGVGMVVGGLSYEGIMPSEFSFQADDSTPSSPAILITKAWVYPNKPGVLQIKLDFSQNNRIRGRIAQPTVSYPSRPEIYSSYINSGYSNRAILVFKPQGFALFHSSRHYTATQAYSDQGSPIFFFEGVSKFREFDNTLRQGRANYDLVTMAPYGVNSSGALGHGSYGQRLFLIQESHNHYQGRRSTIFSDTKDTMLNSDTVDKAAESFGWGAPARAVSGSNNSSANHNYQSGSIMFDPVSKKAVRKILFPVFANKRNGDHNESTDTTLNIHSEDVIDLSTNTGFYYMWASEQRAKSVLLGSKFNYAGKSWVVLPHGISKGVYFAVEVS